MISTADIITRIAANTTYTVREARPQDQELEEGVSTPVISVGYAPIVRSEQNQPAAYSNYASNGENIVQFIYIHYMCAPSDFPAVFLKILKVMSNWNPNNNEYHTGFVFTRGEPFGLTLTTLGFMTEWKLDFPVNTLLN